MIGIDNKNSRTKLTYFGKETRFIAKLFKEIQIRIAFKVNNTIRRRLTPKLCDLNPQQQFEKKVEYIGSTCPDCQQKYVGQTGRSFHERYKEHFHDFKLNIRKSSFATHLLDNNHSMGPTDEIVEVMYTIKKGRFMDALERFHV
jgi:hypothetical protein